MSNAESSRIATERPPPICGGNNHEAIVWSTMHGVVAQSRQARWLGGAARSHKLDFLTGESKVRTLSLALLFSWNGGHVEAEAQSGKKLWSHGNRPNYAAVLPPGIDIDFRIKQKSNYRSLSLTLEQGFLDRVAESEHVKAIEVIETWNYRDPLTWHLARALYDECASDAQQGLLYLEAAMTLLSLQLIRKLSTTTRSLKLLDRGGLSPTVLRRACEYMVSCLAENVSLQEVAGVVGLSPGHFSVAFRRSAGITPYAWLRHQRIVKAKALMRDPTLQLGAIALLVGYANQSALGVAFKRETGLTLREWRQSQFA